MAEDKAGKPENFELLNVCFKVAAIERCGRAIVGQIVRSENILGEYRLLYLSFPHTGQRNSHSSGRKIAKVTFDLSGRNLLTILFICLLLSDHALSENPFREFRAKTRNLTRAIFAFHGTWLLLATSMINPNITAVTHVSTKPSRRNHSF